MAYSYLRVSAKSQLQGGGLDRQEDAARRWCEANDHQLDATLDLGDRGVSAFRGANVRQGALGRFLALAEAGQLGDQPVLLIDAVDRLSRQEPIDSLDGVFLALTRVGVRVVDLEDGGQEYSRATLNRDPLALIKLVLKIGAAHDFSKKLSRRISVHWQQSKERARAGEVMRGRGGQHPFWLQVGDAGQWQFDAKAVEIVRLVFRLAGEHGSGAIAKVLNDRGLATSTGSRWWSSSVSALLKNEAAIGTLVLGQKANATAQKQLRRWEANPQGPPPVVPPIERIETYFPAVVDLATFARVGRMTARRATDPSASARLDQPMHSWLEGLATCQCGSTMTATVERPRGREYRNLRCRKRRLGGGCGCGGKGWRLQWTHAHVICRFPALITALVAASEQAPAAPQGGSLQAQLASVQGRLKAAQGAAGKAERAVVDAVADQGGEADLALLRRLSNLADSKLKEVATAEADVTRVQALIDEEARRPDPAALLSGTEMVELVTALATGESSPTQRKRMNALLKKAGLRVVLDDSRPKGPTVAITLNDFGPLTAPFLGEREMSVLQDLFPPARARGPGRIEQEGGGFLLVGG